MQSDNDNDSSGSGNNDGDRHDTPAFTNPLTVAGAQYGVDATIRAAGGYWPPLANLARLFEECGELARVVNLGYGPKLKKDGEATVAAGEELGDILYTLLVLANSLAIDAEAALTGAIAKVERRNRERGGGAQVTAEAVPSARVSPMTTMTTATEAHMKRVLQSLDDAISAIENAATLAEAAEQAQQAEAVAEQPATPAEPSAADPLQQAYRAFVESQPDYQALYHYRNALAERLRAATRTVPDAVTLVTEPPHNDEPSSH